jgi:hypothetical protein
MVTRTSRKTVPVLANMAMNLQFIKGMEFLGYLSDYELLKNESGPWSWSEGERCDMLYHVHTYTKLELMYA